MPYLRACVRTIVCGCVMHEHVTLGSVQPRDMSSMKIVMSLCSTMVTQLCASNGHYASLNSFLSTKRTPSGGRVDIFFAGEPRRLLMRTCWATEYCDFGERDGFEHIENIHI